VRSAANAHPTPAEHGYECSTEALRDIPGQSLTGRPAVKAPEPSACRQGYGWRSKPRPRAGQQQPHGRPPRSGEPPAARPWDWAEARTPGPRLTRQDGSSARRYPVRRFPRCCRPDRALGPYLPSQSGSSATSEKWHFAVSGQRDVDVVALVQVTSVRAEIALQGAHAGPRVIRRVTRKVVTVRNPADEAIAFNRSPSRSHRSGRVRRIGERRSRASNRESRPTGSPSDLR
jgi:hypothetical protein